VSTPKNGGGSVILPVDEPQAEGPSYNADGFVDRLLAALDTDAEGLAKALKLPAREVKQIVGAQRWRLAETFRDEFWTRLANYIAVRRGALAAVQHEIADKMERDRAAVLRRRLIIEGRQ
jgi:hypothetical protein